MRGEDIETRTSVRQSLVNQNSRSPQARRSPIYCFRRDPRKVIVPRLRRWKINVAVQYLRAGEPRVCDATHERKGHRIPFVICGKQAQVHITLLIISSLCRIP